MVADYASVTGRERRGTLRAAVFGVDGARVAAALTRLWFALAVRQGHGDRLAFRTLGIRAPTGA